MPGSLIKSNNALQCWYQLFKSRGNIRSLQAQKHWHQLIHLGLPTIKNENWKYTSLETFFSQRFVLPQSQKISDDEINEYSLPLDAIRLVFVNGKLHVELSSHDTDLFVIQSNNDDLYHQVPAPIQPEVFLHLTESLAEEVTFICLPYGQVAPRPLYLLHITSGQKNVLNTVHYRHHFALEKHAKAEIIEHYVSLNESAHFTGARFTFSIANNANLNHIKMMFEDSNSYHFAHNDIIIGCNAKVSSTNFLMGAKLLRNNTSVQFNGENSQLSLNSLVLSVNSEVADTRSYLEHNKGSCLSRQLHKAIAFNQSRAVFNGYIKVAKTALKTDSKMTNKNLLIGHLAEVDTKPQLEIYADDVKCSHGATVGHINDEQIFYLRSRGICKEVAQQMLILAFTLELTDSLKNNVLSEVILKSIKIRCPEEVL